MRKLEVSNKTTLQSACKEQNSRNDESRFLHRLHCVLLVAKGTSCYKIAEWFGDHPSTLERWVRNFNEFGVEGLKDEQKTGRPRKVRDDQIKQLQSELSAAPSKLGYKQSTWNGTLLKTHLKQHYNIELGARQCQRLLKELSNTQEN